MGQIEALMYLRAKGKLRGKETERRKPLGSQFIPYKQEFSARQCISHVCVRFLAVVEMIVYGPHLPSILPLRDLFPERALQFYHELELLGSVISGAARSSRSCQDSR